MNKDQWTVVGLLVVLASLEVIRSQAVQSFFSNFFGQFGVGSSPSSTPTPAPTISAGAIPPGGSSTGNKIKGMPGNA